MNELALFSLLVAHAGPVRLDALAAAHAGGARAVVEWPDRGAVRSFASVAGASYGRPEIDITLRAGLALEVGPRVELGWQGTDLEVDDSDGGSRSWACISMRKDF